MPLQNVDELLKQATFKGMVATEAAIMRLWIERHAAEFDSIEFEVRLGEGGEPYAGMPPDLAEQYKHLTQKRADAIAYSGEYAVIIEVKQRLKIRDLGQLLTYRWLYINTHPAAHEPRMLAIAYRSDRDTLSTLAAHAIDVELYPEAE